MTEPQRCFVRFRAVALSLTLVAQAAWFALPTPAAAASGRAPLAAVDSREARDEAGGLRPTIHYEEVVKHAHDRLDFEPGGRVTVGFTPREGDTWKVGGVAPRALPAGRLDGKAMRAQGRAAAPTPAATTAPSATPDVVPTALPSLDPTAAPSPEPSAEPASGPSADPGPDATLPGADVDAPVVDPARVVDAVGTSWTGASTPSGEASEPAAVVSSSGLQREVFGFLPYWELSASSTSIDYDLVSTIAYFGVGADGAGNLQKRNSDGTTTVGWSGWTSSKLTSLLTAAHQNRTRVVLTVQSFGWTDAQLNRQKQLLGSSTARSNLAKQIVAAVRDRGADGVNLDFEPLASGYEDEFVALVRLIRSEFNRVAAGYQITFDTTGYIGNYPLEEATAPGGADAIFIMGYDYRGASSSPVGSVAPLTRTGYDIRETVAAYTARVSPSKLILGVPYYGRAWSTDTDQFGAKNISGTKYGSSATVVYDTAIGYTTQYGRRYHASEGVAWTAYRKETCTSTYGCVTAWRQLYFDDAAALRAKYDLVNQHGLRGAGIWALGYDGSRTELWRAIEDKFAPDTKPPVVGITVLPASEPNPVFTVRWTGTDRSGIASYDLHVSTDGGAWRTWVAPTTATSRTFAGVDGHGYAFRVRGRDTKGNLSAWTVTSVWTGSAKLAVGGFGRVTTDGLTMRASATTSSASLGVLNAGDILAITGGPATANGYTWYRVTGPLAEWGIVGSVNRNVWVATKSSTATWVVGAPAPHTTAVRAVIGSLAFGPAGTSAIGTTSTAVASRALSPNGDGVQDTIRIGWNHAVALDALELRLFRADGSPAGTVPLSQRSAGAHAFTWNGAAGGARLPDGRYLAALVGSAGGTTYFNPSLSLLGTAQLDSFGLTIDTVVPALASSVSRPAISPNGDGIADTTSISWTASELVSGTIRVSRGSTIVRTWSLAGTAGTIAWDGRTASGSLVNDGSYTIQVSGRDAAGNASTRDHTVVVDRTVRLSKTGSRFFPHDGDALAPSTTLSWALARSATVTVQVFRGDRIVRTPIGGRARAAGTYSWTWNGKDATGAYLPRGFYTIRLTATSSVGTTVISKTVFSDAFGVTLSAPTRTSGQSLSVTVSPVEPLAAAPRISLTQSGSSAVTKTATKLADGRYRAVFTIAPGAPGTAIIRMTGTDRRGGVNRSTATVVVQ